jgi:hypothetical protein
MHLVKKISTFVNFDLLVRETLKLLADTNLTQISIQSNGDNDAWAESAGWLKSRHDELKFNNIHPKLKNTVFEEYINSLSFTVYRTRIMVLAPLSSYSIHKDPTPRIHIPITTNVKTAFLFPQNNYMHHMPADGSVYWADTRQEHTFVNYSDQPRIHIVSVIVSNE